MANIDEVTKAYTAGLIDGEGCIDIAKNKSRNLSNGHNIQHYVRVTVGMTDYKAIVYLQKHWGGYVYLKKRVIGQKPQWLWSVRSKMARELLIAIYPYLVAKTDQADIALKFKVEMTGKRMTEETLNFREGLYLTLRELKKDRSGQHR